MNDAPVPGSAGTQATARRTDIAFWAPCVADVLARHGLPAPQRRPLAGAGATFPTFVAGDAVVKFFDDAPSSARSFAAERTVLRRLAGDPAIMAPRLVAAGRLPDDTAPDGIGRSYLVMTRVPGMAWGEADLTFDQRRAAAADLGRQVARIQALDPSGLPVHDDWSVVDPTEAARRSTLPRKLAPEVADFLAAYPPAGRVAVHGDIMFRHVFVEQGRLAGIIDWGDAMATDRHYEFAKLHLDLFACDRTLLRAFLEAAAWPAGSDFAPRSMAMALWRQAHGLAQHATMDVFYRLRSFVPRLDAIVSLDELADALFAV